MQEYLNKYLLGDTIEVLKSIPDETVQCVVTSPPYWGLRTYGDDGQYGLESTLEEHIAKMVDVFREVKRVLRKDGTVWLNYGDSYAQSGSGNGQNNAEASEGEAVESFRSSKYLNQKNPKTAIGHLKPKDLCMIPARVAIALQADGWWIRSEIIWAKPNPMPESCTDRPTSSYEHIFLLTKSAKYFYDADAVREKIAESTENDYRLNKEGYAPPKPERNCPAGKQHGAGLLQPNPLGRNLRNVWTIPTHPFGIERCSTCGLIYSSAEYSRLGVNADGNKICSKCGGIKWASHFATFPPALVKRCVLAGTSHKACEVCGAAWERTTEPSDEYKKVLSGNLGKYHPNPENEDTDGVALGWGESKTTNQINVTADYTTTGFQPTCKCDQKGTGKSIVCDPFMGSGTTAVVAQELGRDWIGIDLGGKDEEYKQMALKRLQGATIGLF